MKTKNEFDVLVDILPPKIKEQILAAESKEEISEIILDLGKEVEVRYSDNSFLLLDKIERNDLKEVEGRLKRFNKFDRVGLDGTIHRISRIPNKEDETIGFTFRVGRDFSRDVSIIKDVISKGKSILFLGPPGAGKAQPLDAKILTPTGWVTMGDIHKYSQVITQSGNIVGVLDVFPQGVKDIYRVTFDDGSSTECCDEHLWTVKTREDRLKNRDYRTLPLKEIAKNFKLKDGKFLRLNYSIPSNPILNFEAKDVTIDPYLLGVLLGDGCMCNNNFKISTEDFEILGHVRNLLPQEYSFSLVGGCDYAISEIGRTGGKGKNYENPLRRELRDLKLWDTRSNSKFIPKDYLFNSRDIREKLLQGLMDTDGYCCKKGSLYYYSASEDLAECVSFLIRSLGGKVSRTIKKPKYKYKGETKEGQLCYVLSFSLPKEIVPFRLSRKLTRYTVSSSRYLTRFIANIEYVGKKEAQCILVDDSSHLYMTDDLILTHNTTKLRSIAKYLSTEMHLKVIVVDGSNEIGGDGDIPHESIGRARRMQVPDSKKQYEVMLRAVENHNPDVIIVDEISTIEDAEAAVTISQRGVQLIATAHGNTLNNLIENNPLNCLLGSTNSVTLSDDSARLKGRASKTQRERINTPAFEILVELRSFRELSVCYDLARAIDYKLGLKDYEPEIRTLHTSGEVYIVQKEKFINPYEYTNSKVSENGHSNGNNGNSVFSKILINGKYK